MRAAAIDVGSNSIHLLVADVSPDGAITVVERGREQVELGAGGLGQNRIADDAFERGIAALVNFKQAADGLGAEAINASATAAVREASNGSEFVKAVRAQTGIHIKVISGIEEAKLVYLGARADLDFSAGPVLLMDLGGGSVEFVLCDARKLLAAVSLPLGHIRLAEAHHASDPLTKADIKRIRATVRAHLEPLLRRLEFHTPPAAPGAFGTLVGTSGAVRTLGRMATLQRGEALPEHGHGLVLHRADLDATLRQFSNRKQSRYGTIPGMDAKRARTLPAAAVFVREVMEALNVQVVQTSERSLRDGLIVEWVMQHAPEIELSRTVAQPRLRSVLTAMERYGVDEAHARHVAALSLQLFDLTAGLHALEPKDRRMLEYASLLHDVGHHIAGEDHNKHGAYLVRHTPLYGFTAPELAVLANLIRYHRGPRPRRRHDAYRALPRSDRRVVRVLAGLLQIADALDRSHTQPVRSVSLDTDDDGTFVFEARADEEAHIERWAVQRRRALLEAALGQRIDVVVRQP